MNLRTYFRGLLYFCVLNCFIWALLLHFPYRWLTTSPPLPFNNFFYNYTLEKPLDADQTCQFPNLDPYDPSIRSHLSTARPIRCLGRDYLTDFVFVDDEAKLRINQTALNEIGYEWSSLSCEYKKIIRDEGNDVEIHYGSAVSIQNDGQPLEDEFVLIRCKKSGSIVSYGLHTNVVRKPSLANRQEDSTSEKVIKSQNKPNVLILVLDSMSRSNFIRQLPETYKYLVGNMSAVVLRGMAKVGDNTYPNLVPILTGLQARYYPELAPLTGRYESWPGFMRPERYDNWPFLWKNFSTCGYATMLAEDKTEMNTFNYLKQGFAQPPTDHYMRPFWLAMESSGMSQTSSRFCYGSKPKHLIQLDYMRRFIRTYRRVPHFGFSTFTELSHDCLNQIGAADGDWLGFLQDLHRDGSLDNTFLVMMGDHGHRLDSIVETIVGSMESKMPFMAIYVPPWFRHDFPDALQNLERNSRRLTSMRDLHFTLLDILEYARVGAGIGQQARPIDGTTLFSPVPASRSCLQAGIPYQFCACYKEQRINEDHPGVRVASIGLVESINSMTAPHRKFCAEVTLVAVRNVAIVTSYAKSNLTGSSLEAWELGMDMTFRISVKVSPSGGLFEGMAVMRMDGQPRIMEGTIRLNRYGNQANCLPEKDRVRNPNLREFCYCPGYR